jgi:hypothetical protein
MGFHVRYRHSVVLGSYVTLLWVPCADCVIQLSLLSYSRTWGCTVALVCSTEKLIDNVQ